MTSGGSSAALSYQRTAPVGYIRKAPQKVANWHLEGRRSTTVALVRPQDSAVAWVCGAPGCAEAPWARREAARTGVARRCHRGQAPLVLNRPPRQRREKSQLRHPSVAPARARRSGRRTRAYSRNPGAHCTRARAPRGSRSGHSGSAPRPPRPCPCPRMAPPSRRKPGMRKGAGRGSGTGTGTGMGMGTSTGASAVASAGRRTRYLRAMRRKAQPPPKNRHS